MFKSKPNWSVIFFTIVLCLSTGISMIIHPEVYSLEPFMLIAIASMLAGIWHELKEMNKQRSDAENQIKSDIE